MQVHGYSAITEIHRLDDSAIDGAGQRVPERVPGRKGLEQSRHFQHLPGRNHNVEVDGQPFSDSFVPPRLEDRKRYAEPICLLATARHVSMNSVLLARGVVEFHKSVECVRFWRGIAQVYEDGSPSTSGWTTPAGFA